MIATDGREVWIVYRNHRGETAWRCIRPITITFGESQWHPGEQWLLLADDLDKNARRTFALKDVLQWRDTKSDHNEGTRMFADDAVSQ